MSRRSRVDESDMLPYALRGVYLRTTFGLQTNEGSMDAIASTSKDEEIIGVAGNRVALIHCNDPISADHKIRTFLPVCSAVSSIKFIRLSPSKAFLACSVTLNAPCVPGKTTAIIYALDKDDPLFSKPATISYETKKIRTQESSTTFFTALAFSHQEADHLAGIIDNNILQQGILVFNWRVNEVIQQISIKGSVTCLSFFPNDSWKLCCSGRPNFLQYWHFNGRYANQAPIGDANVPKRDYTCHVWLDEHNLLVGSTDGYVSLIKGCDVIQHVRVFEKLRDGDVSYDEVGVDHIVNNADVVIVCNTHNVVACLEIKRVDYTKTDSAVRLEYVNRFVCGEHRSLCGLCWAFKSEYSNTLIVASIDTIELYEFEKVLETVEMPIVMKPRETIASFHSKGVDEISVPCKSGTFLSSSSNDSSIRLWAMNSEKNVNMFQMNFPNGIGLPMTLNVHPSGRRVATGDEDFYKELALTDTNLESMQEFSVKVSMTAPHGEAFSNTSPCSKVLYSNSGHLLAVITGRLGQVFNMFNLTYGIDGAHPTRVMVMMDHTSMIGDICFNSTDSKIFTSSYDGTILEYDVGNSTKVREYSFKAIPVLALRCSPTDQIIALIEPGFDSQAIVKRKSTRRSSTAISTGSFTGKVAVSVDSEKKTKSQYLCVWGKDLSKKPNMTRLDDIYVNSMDVGKFYIDNKDTPDYVAFGTSDGNIVVSLLPLPVKQLQDTTPPAVPIPKSTSSQVSPAIAIQNRKQSIQAANLANAAGRTGVDASSNILCDDVLNLKYCKRMQLHSGSVSCIAIVDSGFWIISGGVDGAINIIGTTRRYGPDVEIPECSTPESTVGLMNITNVRDMTKKLHMMESNIEDTVVRKDREITHVKMFSEKQIHKLENVLKREVHKRDTIIIQERNENIRKAKDIVREYEEKLKAERKACANLEVKYEKKLAKEGAYLDKMKQSYDEFIVHARLDLEKSKRDTKRLAEEYENDSASHELHLNKTKEQLLQYVDYMRDRYNEVITQVEDSHAAKLSEALLKLEDAQKANDIADAENKEHTNMLVRDIRSLKEEVAKKEGALDKAIGDLEWSNGKVARLEEALEKATADIERRADTVSKLEFKAGEQRQQLSELERIRKVLVSQLQMVRQELRPTEEKLIIANRDILDGEREYQTTIQVMSDKQKRLAFQSEKMHGLQDQLKSLKRKLFEKESLLSNAANLFREYKYALQRATFDRKKVTVVDPTEKFPATGGNPSMNKSLGDPTESIWDEDSVQNGMVEILSRNRGMESSLKRLDKILGSISNVGTSGNNDHQSSDEELVAAEQKRNMLLMHRNLQVLKNSKNNAEEAADLKESKLIRENRSLIEMMNGLKQQLTLVSREKQMWKARADTLEMQMKGLDQRKDGDGANIKSIQMKDPNTRPPSPTLSYADSIMSIPTLDGEIQNVEAPVVNMSAKDKIDAIYRDNEAAIVSGLRDYEEDDDTSGSMMDILAHHMKSVGIPPGNEVSNSPTDVLNRVKEKKTKPSRNQKLASMNVNLQPMKSSSTSTLLTSQRKEISLVVNAQPTKIGRRSQMKLLNVSSDSKRDNNGVIKVDRIERSGTDVGMLVT